MTEAKKPKKPRGKARLIPGKCIACGARCQSACPVNCVEMTDAGEPVILSDKCIGCLKCIKVCPAEALEIQFTPEELALLEELARQQGGAVAEEEPDDEATALAAMLSAYRGVWVFIEQTEGEAAKVSWELLGKGRELADAIGVPLSAIVLGDQVEPLCHEAFAHGADRAYLIDAPVLKHYRTESYLRCVCHLIGQ
ncbi:4Fe-4S dicluster domain-containing protein, partial [Geobacter sp. OR-1]|uniref:4Fe-4S dicluster domain-containing protein n=1 Tax=Geobacter sp. OR-1 TaxID=1266765 RepID=UPI0005A7E590